MTASTLRWRGSWPSVRKTEQAAPHGLDRRPHVPVARHQVPARLAERGPGLPPAGVDALGRARDAVLDDLRPDAVAIARHYGMRAAAFQGLLRIQRCVDAAEHHVRSPFTRRSTDLVAAQRIARVNSDSDNVTVADPIRVERLQRLVGYDRIAPLPGRRLGQHVQPARRDDGHAEGDVTRVDQMNLHARGVLKGRRSGWGCQASAIAVRHPNRLPIRVRQGCPPRSSTLAFQA